MIINSINNNNNIYIIRLIQHNNIKINYIKT